MGRESECRAGVVEKMREPDKGDVGLFPIAVGDRWELDIGALDQSDRHARLNQRRPIVGAASQVGLNGHLQRSTGASYLENYIENGICSAAVLGADVDPPASRQRLDNPLEL